MPINPPDILADHDPGELERMDAVLLDANGRLRMLKAADIRALGSHDVLRAWMVTRGRYMLPTLELIACIGDRLWNVLALADEEVLEVGAGMGDFGRMLGVRMTDSYVQQRRDMRLLYQAMGQTVTAPPKDVERIDAIAAAKKYKPKVILASWVTQAYQQGDEVSHTGSCVYGPNESHLLRLCEHYVYVGNIGVHGDKRLLKEPHEELAPGCIVSRAKDPSLDRVWIWTRRR